MNQSIAERVLAALQIEDGCQRLGALGELAGQPHPNR